MVVISEGWNVQQGVADIGEGNLGWTEVLSAWKEANIREFAVAQDECMRDPFESLQNRMENLKAMGLE